MCQAGGGGPRTVRACEHSGVPVSLDCSSGTIHITAALYGRKQHGLCPGPVYTTDCESSRSLSTVKSKCDGHSTCSVQASNSLFGDPCQGTVKYLEVTYQCEVNVALSKKATQSSLLRSEYPAERAVDGNTGTILYPRQQCTHTDLEYEPWWKVNLGDTYVISHVTVINRGDCCGERLRNFMVRVGPHGDFRENTPCGDIYSETPSEGETIDVRCEEPISGRWVSVQLIGREDYLSLCEVQVFSGTDRSCSRLPEVEHGMFEVSSSDSTVGRVVCNDGYRVLGNPVLRCDMTGHWGGALPRCIVHDCGKPKQLKNGARLGSGHAVEYNCNKGYLMVAGDGVRTCQSNGVWSGEHPVCKKADCPQLPKAEGRLRVLGSQLITGSMVRFVCPPGYDLHGPTTSTCGTNGQWSHGNDLPECDKNETEN
ncbi:PREDICTED: zona pellucida sperm-binding protein 3 receptor-like [Branchiostoma belcheri]|uniref:Zona pellucida sperm-binding protein 3 receptor-like n=1 Tax=Branchiostoma belcheri TaxID=7741 RepID=A0A6P5ASW7_BRABE|nr:PREDICTED: zona pellucida sperm-binding protein 3 receptor-like [Branchiostoma belcheri]